MKNRIISILLAILMLASVMTLGACSENASDGSKETESTTATNTPASTGEGDTEQELSDLEQRMLIPDDLPDVKYDGKELRVLTNNGNQYIEEIYVEELTGDNCNDAVYNRNDRIEVRFDVKILCEGHDSPAGQPKVIAQAGTPDYHIVGLYDYQSYTPINAQALLNWYDTPHFNPEKPWHNKLANDDATVNGILYTVCSDLAITSMTYTHCVFTNLDLAQTFGFSAEDLYGFVKEGKWTIDFLDSTIASMYVDKNGNGKADNDDQYGFGYYICNPADVWYNAFGEKITGRDDSGNVTINFMSDKTVSIIEKLMKFHYENEGFKSLSAQYDEQTWFLNQKLVFAPMRFYAAFATLRDMDASYTMLPYPKWDEAQEHYYTNADDKFTVFGLPTPSYNEIDFIGVIYEALSAESYKTVYPVYYDVALKGRYSTDATTAEMVELIMAGRLFDFSFQFGEDVIQRIPYLIRDCLNDQDVNIASRYKKLEKALKKGMEKKFAKNYKLE
ncbi:MAG: hypothetical protein IKQ92_05830 [Clostridia bacterium]|nr:hypothetical protein [Clostridia bacterium]